MPKKIVMALAHRLDQVTEQAIEVQGLAKHFKSVVALDGIDLSVPTGTVYGLLGPNGAGKTTAIRILTTLLLPDAGTATVLGHDVVKDADTVRRSIGLAGQFAAVDLNLTGYENLRLIGKLTHIPKREIESRADELLARFDLTDARDRVVKTYSGGMKRRLDLAAALVHRPRVLFLDEPTTGLDPHSRADLWDIIRELVADGTTLLLTTQYLEEADKLAERLAVIDHGQVIAEGTSADLKNRMGNTVVEISFADEHSAQQAVPVLQRFALKEAETDESTVRLITHDGSAVLVEALRALDTESLQPAGLAVREPSLDDVFLALTGRRTSADEQNAGGGR